MSKKRKMPAWKRVLNKKDLAHCRTECMTSLAAVKRTKEHQDKMLAEGFGLPCSDCFNIFYKLKDKGFL